MQRRLGVSLCAILLLSQICLAQAPATSSQSDDLTIEKIFKEGGVTGRGPETLKWSPDGTKLSYVQRDDAGEHGELWYIDTASGNKAVLVAEQKLQSLAPPASSISDERQKEWATRYSVAAYQWAPDSKHLLFDSHGQLWYYSLDNGIGVQITTSADASSDPKFSPDGKEIAYVRKHDIWIHPLNDNENEHQLTTKGDENLLNGEVDWVYAEELAVRSNYFWSPDSRQIAFLQMNQKQVPTYPITDWMPVHAKVEEQKYPQPGDPNPEVRVGVVELGGRVHWINAGDPKDKDIYIPRFGWVRDGLLYIQVLNRAQDKLQLYFADVATGRSKLVLTETSDAWVDVRHDFKILKSGDQFLWSSWRDGHTHLYLYSFDKRNPLGAEAKLVTQLTKGHFEVLDVATIDEDAGLVYFSANADDPREAQTYSVKLDGSGMQKVTTGAGSHRANFAPSAKYFADDYSAVLSPPHLSFCTVAGSCQVVWESRSLEGYSLIAPQQIELKAADGKTTLYGSLLLPPGAEHGQVRQYPLILNPYGGPGGMSVHNAWGGTTFLFHQIMARRGFAILTVDNRGMGNRGKDFAAALKHKFGTVELDDQLAALDQVLQRYPMLDPNRLGWWGWSYGGFMTLTALTHSDRFKAGVSVAPVTDWRLYDSIYTERYMGLPKDNEQGYKNGSPVNFAANLHGRLLEVHGTSDDNVHMQNTIQMVRHLVNAGKQFDLALYPNKTHGISGFKDRMQLFHRIQDQFERWLLNAQE